MIMHYPEFPDPFKLMTILRTTWLKKTLVRTIQDYLATFISLEDNKNMDHMIVRVLNQFPYTKIMKNL